MRRRVQPSRHYDASAPWAREPRLTPVIRLPLRSSPRSSANRRRNLIYLGIGAALGFALRGIL